MDLPQLGLSFLAGLLSFFSPCVLAVAPGYLGMLTGKISYEGIGKREALHATILFILGFSVVFALLGTAFSAVGQFLRIYQKVLLRGLGLVVVIFGLQTLGVLRLSALFREKRFSVGKVRHGPFKPMIIGAAFAFGWTPCVGPILGTILAMASTTESLGAGFGLLAVYSAGMAIPFIAMALAFTSLQRLARFMLRHAQWVERFSGLLLIAMGILLFFDQLKVLSMGLNRILNGWSPENWLIKE